MTNDWHINIDVELIDLLMNAAIYRDLNFPIFLIDHVRICTIQ